MAEATAARAGVAKDHECGSAALPALANIWAGSFLANGVEVLLADHVPQFDVLLSARWWDLEPGWLALAHWLHFSAKHVKDIHTAWVRAAPRLQFRGLGELSLIVAFLNSCCIVVRLVSHLIVLL